MSWSGKSGVHAPKCWGVGRDVLDGSSDGVRMWTVLETDHPIRLDPTSAYIAPRISTLRAMTLIAILIPWLSFFLRGKPFAGILCVILQISLIGWIPAAIWALVSLSEGRAERRNKKLIKAVSGGR